MEMFIKDKVQRIKIIKGVTDRIFGNIRNCKAGDFFKT
jgi:hypothetical protein